MRLAKAVAVAIVLTACDFSEDISKDPDARTDDMGQEGERLRQRTVDAGPAGTQFLGWQDTRRDERCAFRKGPDGELRCMPTESVRELRGMSGLEAIVYTDANCTTPVYVTQIVHKGECGAPLKYVFLGPEATDDCSPEYYYAYEIGDEIPSPGIQLYAKRDIGCHDFRTVADLIAFEATEIPATEFVPGKEIP